jgi:hypothetical protein
MAALYSGLPVGAAAVTVAYSVRRRRTRQSGQQTQLDSPAVTPIVNIKTSIHEVEDPQ